MNDTPVPLILHCPDCRTRHVDEGEWADRVHHTHSCQNCGLTWRPAVVPTVGVAFLPGFRNEAAPSGNLTADQLMVACRNVGFDLRCGACASLFYTGYGDYQHDDNCHTTIPWSSMSATAILKALATAPQVASPWVKVRDYDIWGRCSRGAGHDWMSIVTVQAYTENGRFWRVGFGAMDPSFRHGIESELLAMEIADDELRRRGVALLDKEVDP